MEEEIKQIQSKISYFINVDNNQESTTSEKEDDNDNDTPRESDKQFKDEENSLRDKIKSKKLKKETKEHGHQKEKDKKRDKKREEKHQKKKNSKIHEEQLTFKNVQQKSSGELLALIKDSKFDQPYIEGRDYQILSAGMIEMKNSVFRFGYEVFYPGLDLTISMFMTELLQVSRRDQMIALFDFMKRSSIVNQKHRDTFLKIISNAGAGPEEQRGHCYQKDKEECDYGKGWFSDVPEQDKVQKFQPEKVNFSRIWHGGWKSSEFLDCMVHATNSALGFEWFQCREQVIRLLRAKMKLSEDAVFKYKQRHGIDVKYFNNYVCDEEDVYSLKLTFSWSMKDKNGLERPNLNQNQFMKIFEQSNNLAFIVLIAYSEDDGNNYRHAFCIKKTQRKGLAIIDSIFDKTYFTDARDVNQIWDLDIWFAKLLQLSVFEFQKSIFASKKGNNQDLRLRKAEVEKIKRIMTGDKYVPETKGIQSRTGKGW